MAATSNTKTRAIPRDQLRAMVGDNPRLLKLLEDMTTDITVTLPTALDDTAFTMLFGLVAQDGSKSAATTALALVLEVQSLQSAAARAASAQAVMRAELDALTHEVASLRRMLTTATQALNTATDAQALAIAI